MADIARGFFGVFMDRNGVDYFDLSLLFQSKSRPRWITGSSSVSIWTW